VNGRHSELHKCAEPRKQHLNWIGTYQNGLATGGLFSAVRWTDLGENGAAAFTSGIEGGAWGYTAIRGSRLLRTTNLGGGGRGSANFCFGSTYGVCDAHTSPRIMDYL
jgi:hypothetical protein